MPAPADLTSAGMLGIIAIYSDLNNTTIAMVRTVCDTPRPDCTL